MQYLKGKGKGKLYFSSIGIWGENDAGRGLCTFGIFLLFMYPISFFFFSFSFLFGYDTVNKYSIGLD